MRRIGRLGVALGMVLMVSGAWGQSPPSSVATRIEFLLPGMAIEVFESCEKSHSRPASPSRPFGEHLGGTGVRQPESPSPCPFSVLMQEL